MKDEIINKIKEIIVEDSRSKRQVNNKDFYNTLKDIYKMENENKQKKIYDINEFIFPEPPLHLRCRCIIERMETFLAGTATTKGRNGADWYLKHYGKLPNYYIMHAAVCASIECTCATMTNLLY